MAIQCDEYNGVCVVSVEGDFSGECSAAVRRVAADRIEQKQIVEFVIDLEKSKFIDGEALETLLWLKRRCEELFGRVKLAGTDENCRKILEITRLAQRFECCADLPSALRMMR